MVIDRVIDRARRLPPLAVDCVLGLIVFLAYTLPNPFAVPIPGLLTIAASALSVTLRRKNLGAAIGIVLLIGVIGLVTRQYYWTGDAPWLAWLILLYSIAERCSALIAGIALLAAIVLGSFFADVHWTRLELDLVAFEGVPWIAIAWFAGRAQARRRRIASQLERTAEALHEERALLMRSAVTAERVRIATDLHELVQRGVQSMNVATRAARHLLGEDPARAAALIDGVESSARDALVEMRRLLAVLRRDDVVVPSIDGGPGFDDPAPRDVDNRTALPEGPSAPAQSRESSRRHGIATRWFHSPWGPDVLAVIALATMSLVEHVFASRVFVAKGVPLGCCHTRHATLWIALMIVVVLWRRVAPLVVLAVVAVLNFVPYMVPSVGGVAWAGDMVVAVAAYSVGARRGPRWGVAAIGAVALSYSAVGTQAIHFDWWMVGWALQFALAVVAGIAVHASRALSAKLADENEMLRRTREERVRLAVVEERARIARDVHDLVAHGLTLIVIQAGAARELAETDPQKADQALRSVERAALEALRELDVLIEELGLVSPSRIGALPAQDELSIRSLVDQHVEAGTRVDLIVHGSPHPIGAGLEMSLYRIVQEALTNAGKHAPGARVWVELRYSLDGVEVEVTDAGGATPDAPPVPGAGHGLVGITERAALFGGRAEYGPTPAGGFRVNVALVEAPALV